jgi:hypothetical protein
MNSIINSIYNFIRSLFKRKSLSPKNDDNIIVRMNQELGVPYIHQIEIDREALFKELLVAKNHLEALTPEIKELSEKLIKKLPFY